MSHSVDRKSSKSTPVAFYAFFAIFTFVLIMTSVLFLEQNSWVQNQTLWLISRASAISSYIALTCIVFLGIVLSHPRNKDTWKLTPKLLPWHQAAVGIMFLLLAVHLMFTLADSKSGVALSVFWSPTHSKYHHIAMLFGVIGFYLLLLVGITSGLRKWVRMWLPIHRVSWILWAIVSLHGFYGGTDSTRLEILYGTAAFVLIGAFFWRHWTNNERRGVKQVNKHGMSVR